MSRRAESSSKHDDGWIIGSLCERLFDQGIVVTSFKIKYPAIDPLIILSAKTTEGPKIAFIGGATIASCLKAVEGMQRSNSIDWKEDKFELKRLAQKGED